MHARKSTLSFCWSGGLSSLELSAVGDATTLFEEALGLYRELSDDFGIATTTYNLALSTLAAGGVRARSRARDLRRSR